MSKVLGLDPDDIFEVAEFFVDNSNVYIDTLSECSSASPESIRAAHTLKGSAANLGLDQISEFAKSVETDLRNGILPKEGIEKLIKSFEEFKVFMER